jgi:hypothetical protein
MPPFCSVLRHVLERGGSGDPGQFLHKPRG